MKSYQLPIVKHGTFILSKCRVQSSCRPVVVVVRMLEPFAQQREVVVRVAADRGHRLEPLRPRRAADAIAFVEQAQPGVDHVLADQMRRLRDGEKVLREAGLRAAERADLPGGPRLRREPFADVVAVLLLAPAERPIADPRSLRTATCRGS